VWVGQCRSEVGACTVEVDVNAGVISRIGLVGMKGVYGGIIRICGVRELRA
jgi:hypothetical protein